MYLDEDATGSAIAETLNAKGIDTYTIARLNLRIEQRRTVGKSTTELEQQLIKAIEAGKDRWSPQSIYQILRNPMITGRRKAGGQRNPKGRTILRVDPIIDAATFRRLQEKMAQKGNRNGSTNSETAMLTGILRCGYCRGPMYRIRLTPSKRNPNGKVYTYYRCHGNERAASTCRFMIPLEDAERKVETLVWDMWGHEPYKEVTVIPGTDWDDEIKAVKEDFNASHDPEDDDFLDARNAMLAEIARLRAEPRKRDEVIEKIVPGLTRADVWMMGPTVAEQRAALKRWVGSLYAYREPTPDDPKGFGLRAA